MSASPHDLHEALQTAQAIIARQADRIQELEQMVQLRDAEKVILMKAHDDDQAKLLSLRRRIQQMQRELYGSANEKHTADQHVVDDLRGKTRPADTPQNEAPPGPGANAASGTTSSGAGAPPPPDSAPGSPPSKPPRTRKPGSQKPGGRVQLWNCTWLPMRDELLDVPAAERFDAAGHPLLHLGDHIAWRLDLVPAHFQRIRIIRPFYGLPFVDGPRICAAPYAAIVDKGLPTDALLARVVADKYDMYLPLYRQEHRTDDLGLPILRPTLMQWVYHAATALEPIQDAIGASILRQPVLGLDDTYLPVLEPGTQKCHQGRLWGYLANEEFYCEYRATREGKWPMEFLTGYRGTVLGDAYSGHKALFVSGDRTPAGCLSHARRKFDAAVKLGEPIAKRALDHFSAIYAVEAEVAGQSSEQILAARQHTTAGIMDKLETLLHGWTATERPTSATWIASNYTLKIFDQLRTFTRDGRVPADNNALERCWRGIGIGRRNWLFAGSARGGGWTATLSTICQSCRLVGLDPYRYMTDIFREIHAGRKDYEQLRPAAWAELHQSLPRVG
jgi:transposase